MKTTISLLLALLLGILVASEASAQIRPGVLRDMNLRGLGRIPSEQLRDALRPSLPSGVVPIPPDVVPIPPGPIREVDPTPAPLPPVPMPTRPGVVFNIGPHGGSLGIPLGGGNRINLGLPRGRILQPQYQPQPMGYHIPGHVTGYGPYGGIHTGSGYVAGSAHAMGRNISQHNGTGRQVQRPVLDSLGNVIGYQQGTVWNNSITGQEHGNMTTYTPNGLGGTHQSRTMYSTAGGNITPIRN